MRRCSPAVLAARSPPASPPVGPFITWMPRLCVWGEQNRPFPLIPSWKNGPRRKKRTFTRQRIGCCNSRPCRRRTAMEKTVMMPKLGMTMEEGTVLNWRYQEGEWVDKDEALVEVMTDKVNLEVEAPFPGRLHILAKEGEVLPVGAPIATLSDEKQATARATPAAATATAPTSRSEPAPSPAEATDGSQKGAPLHLPVASTPAAKREAAQHG